MTTVYWTPVTTQSEGEELYEMEVLFGEPRPLAKEIANAYKDYLFIQCPATQAFYRNTFVITAPMSGVIQVGENENGSATIATSGHGWDKSFYDAFSHIREDKTVTLPPTYLFYAKESLEMEVLPVFLLNSPSLDNAFFTPASFDIGRWIRPVDFSFVPKDYTKPITINRGDPLYFVRFKSDERVVLERVPFTRSLRSMMHACVSVKKRVRNITLPVLYEMAKSRINLFFKGSKHD
jgi:hypothetical protein